MRTLLFAVLVHYTVGQSSSCSQSLTTEDNVLTNANLQAWTASAGCGRWEVQSNGYDVIQRSDLGCPTFFTTNQDHANFVMGGTINVKSDSDDDMIGFVLGAKKPSLDSPMSYDMTLLDWKKYGDCLSDSDSIFPTTGTSADTACAATFPNMTSFQTVAVGPAGDTNNRMPEGFMLTKVNAKCKCNAAYEGIWASTRPLDQYNVASACEVDANLDCGVCADQQSDRMGTSPADCGASGQNTPGAVMDVFWDHKVSALNAGSILGQNLGPNRGWRSFTEYTYRVLYTESRIKVVIDGGAFNWETIFDVPAPAGQLNPVGMLGFYTLSQENVQFSNVQLVDIDLAASTPVAKSDSYALQNPKTVLTVLGNQGLLANDYDPTLSKLTIAVNGAPVTNVRTELTTSLGGKIFLNPDGSFEYIAPKNPSTMDTLTYTVLNTVGATSIPATAQFNFPAKDVAKIVFTQKPLLSKPLRNDVVLGSVLAYDTAGKEVCNPVITITDDGPFRLEGNNVMVADETQIVPQSTAQTYTALFRASTQGGKPFSSSATKIITIPPTGSECDPINAVVAPCGSETDPVWTEITEFQTLDPVPAACHVNWTAVKDADHSKLYLNFEGGDANMNPKPGESMTDANGKTYTWYQVTRTGADKLTSACYVMFFTATVCTNVAQSVKARFIHDDEFWLYIDGERIYLQEGWTNTWKDFPALVPLKKGCNHLVFKLHNGGGPGRFGFSLAPLDCAARLTISPYDNAGADPVCAQDCQFAEWSEWSKCSKDCGGGVQFRSRKVTEQAKYGGLACPETNDQKENQECNVQDCPPGCGGAAPDGCGKNGRCVGVDRCLCSHGWVDVNAPPSNPAYTACAEQQCACTSWGDTHLMPFCGATRFDWMPLGCYRTAAYYGWEIHESHFKCNPKAPQVACSQGIAVVAPGGWPTFEINIVPRPNSEQKPDGILKVNGGAANGGEDIDPSRSPLVYTWQDKSTGADMSINIATVKGGANSPNSWALWPDNGQFHTRLIYDWWSEIPTYYLNVETTTNAGKAAIWNPGVVDYEYNALRSGTVIKKVYLHDPAIAKIQGNQYSPHPACSEACSAEPSCTHWSLDRTATGKQCRGTNSTCILMSDGGAKKVSECDVSGVRDAHLHPVGASGKPTLCGGGPTENLDAAGTNVCGVSQLNRGPLGPPNDGVSNVPRGFENIGNKVNGTASAGGMTSEQLGKYMVDNGVTQDNANILKNNQINSNQLGQLSNQILTDYGITDVNQQNIILGNGLLLRQEQTRMTSEQTASWLQGQGASSAATDLLRQNNVNGQQLFYMTYQQLRDMGLTDDDARTVYGLAQQTMVDGTALSREAVYGLMLAKGVSLANAQLMYNGNIDGNALQYLTVDQLAKLGITTPADQQLIMRRAGSINQAVELGSIIAPPSEIAIPTAGMVKNFLLANNVDQATVNIVEGAGLTGEQLTTYTPQDYVKLGITAQNAAYLSALGKIGAGETSSLSTSELLTWLYYNQQIDQNAINTLGANQVDAARLRTITQTDLIAMNITDSTQQAKILSAKKALIGELNTQSVSEISGLLSSAGVSTASINLLIAAGVDGTALRDITIDQLNQLGLTDPIEQQKIIGTAAYVARGVERMSAYELGGWLMTRGVSVADAALWTNAGIAGGSVARGLQSADLAATGISASGTDRILGLLVGENLAGRTPQYGCTAKQLYTAQLCCAQIPDASDCNSVMIDSCNNWVPGMPMACDDVVWMTTMNNQAGDMNGGINLGNGTTSLGTDPSAISQITLTQPVAQMLLDDANSGNTQDRQIILDGKTYDVSYVSNMWQFSNTLNNQDEWNVDVFTETNQDGLKTLNYIAQLNDPNGYSDDQPSGNSPGGNSPSGSDGDSDGDSNSDSNDANSNDGPIPEETCACCPDSFIVGDSSCTGQVTLECPPDWVPDVGGFTTEHTAWCSVVPTPPSTCLPSSDKLILTVEDDHSIYHKFYDPSTHTLLLAIGALSDEAQLDGSITMKYGAVGMSSDYRLGSATDECKSSASGSGVGALAFFMGMLLVCLPLAGYMGYKMFQRTKEDGSTWDSSGKASAAGSSEDYQEMGNGGM